jgi:hypothetical protein
MSFIFASFIITPPNLSSAAHTPEPLSDKPRLIAYSVWQVP